MVNEVNDTGPAFPQKDSLAREVSQRPATVAGVGNLDLRKVPSVRVSKAKIPPPSSASPESDSFVSKALGAVREGQVTTVPSAQTGGSSSPPTLSSSLLSHYVNPEEMLEAQQQVSSLLRDIGNGHPGESPDACYALCLEVLDTDPNSFPKRVALMQEIIRSGSSFPTWKVFTVGSGAVRGDIWPFVLNEENWVPQMRQIMRHSVSMAEVRGKGLDAKATRDRTPTLEVSKGGFGVGKTHFLRGEYGDMAEGVVAPDRMKSEQQRLFPGLTSGQVHIQSSACATKVIDRLTGSSCARVVYDSSMSDPVYLGSFFQSAQAAGRGAVVNDFVRTDMARAAGVLLREVGGPDPNIPASHVLGSSVYEAATRPKCIAMAADPESFLQQDAVPRDIDYRLYLGDEQGGFPEHCVRIHYHRGEGKAQIQYEYGTPDLPESEKAAIRERLDRQLADRHIVFGEEAASQCSDANMLKWQSEARVRLRGEFLRPVSDVLVGPQQAKMAEAFARRRLIEAGQGKECHSWEEFSELIHDPDVRQSFQSSLKALRDANSGELNPPWTEEIQDRVARGEGVTYNDLPFALALELQSHLRANPWP